MRTFCLLTAAAAFLLATGNVIAAATQPNQAQVSQLAAFDTVHSAIAVRNEGGKRFLRTDKTARIDDDDDEDDDNEERMLNNLSALKDLGDAAAGGIRDMEDIEELRTAVKKNLDDLLESEMAARLGKDTLRAMMAKRFKEATGESLD